MTQGGALGSEGDRYLVSGIQAGDSDAFRQLVERYGGRLRAYAANRLSGTGFDPDDAVQDAFLGLLQGIDRLSRVRSLEAYLFQILRNKVFDMVSRRPEAHGMRRVPLLEEDASGERRGFEPEAHGLSPSGYVRRDETAENRDELLADILEEALAGMKEERNFRDLKILELLFFAAWRNRDIAQAVGVSEPTVTRVKQDALARLARLAARHALGSHRGEFLGEEEDATALIRHAWGENLLGCLKRNTLGAFALGVLDEEWRDYVRFHIEVARCEACAANLADLREEASPPSAAIRERIFQSSVGFLKKR